MSKQINLDSAEADVIKDLIDRYGDKITLGELLNNQNKQPIAEVNFNLEGIYMITHTNSQETVSIRAEQ